MGCENYMTEKQNQRRLRDSRQGPGSVRLLLGFLCCRHHGGRLVQEVWRACLTQRTAAGINYVISAGGIDTEESYPYKGRKHTCEASSGDKGASFTSVVSVESKSEEALKTATATQGPISVG